MGRLFLLPEEGLFHGDEAYSTYCERGLRVGQGLRVYNYGTMRENEHHFVVGLEGELYNQYGKIVDPKNVLNGENGWCFEGGLSNLLPDDVVLRLSNL
jgi:hypothetical protein